MDFEQKFILFFAGAACMTGLLLILEGVVTSGILAIVWGAGCVAFSHYF